MSSRDHSTCLHFVAVRLRLLLDFVHFGLHDLDQDCLAEQYARGARGVPRVTVSVAPRLPDPPLFFLRHQRRSARRQRAVRTSVRAPCKFLRLAVIVLDRLDKFSFKNASLRL